MKRITTLLLVLCLSASFNAIAGNCSSQYAGDQEPQFHNPQTIYKLRPLCFKHYALMHSGATRTPMWAGEHLLRENMYAARKIRRSGEFRSEAQLPASERSELEDFKRTGYDRGHLAPSGDFPSADSQNESFTLANIVPQNPNNNQNLWQGIESSVRDLAIERGELYVVTGPIFEGASLKRIKGRVMVPTGLYKAVYDPKRRQAAAYVVKNSPGMDYEVVPIVELEKRLGMNLFPALPASIKGEKMNLPAPNVYGYAKQDGRSKSSNFPSIESISEKATAHVLEAMMKQFR